MSEKPEIVLVSKLKTEGSKAKLSNLKAAKFSFALLNFSALISKEFTTVVEKVSK